MPQYTIKIGEIELRSSKPITAEERQRALAELRREYPGLLWVVADGIEVRLAVHSH